MEITQIRETVLQLFEAARQVKESPFVDDRFLSGLTEPPAPEGRSVQDTFRGQARHRRFLRAVELEFGICFARKDWDRGFTLEEFVERISQKIAKPERDLRLAQSKLEEARTGAVDTMVKVGLFCSPFFLGAAASSDPLIREGFIAAWFVILGVVGGFIWKDLDHLKKLVQRVELVGWAERAG